MKNDQLQVCATAREVEPGKDWIQLFPAGRFMAYDGRGPFHLKDPQSIIKASMRPQTDLFIDREHGAEFLPQGTPNPAAGWIKEMEVRNGEIWARVEWTPAAQAELAAKEFRYISPVFFTDKKTGVVSQILHASLVKSPALEMKAVASAQVPPLSQTKEKPTMENPQDPATANQPNAALVAIAALLGLSTTTNSDAIVQAVAEMKTTLTAVSQALGVDNGSAPSVLVEAASTKGKADPLKFVPIDQVTNLQAEVASLKKDRAEEKAAVAVADAIKSGKLQPALKDWGLTLASANPQGFADFVSKQTAVVTAGATATEKKPDGEGVQVNEQELEIAASLGVSADAYKATKTKYPTA